MQGYARHAEHRRATLVALLSLGLCAACDASRDDTRFDIDDLVASWSNGRIDVRVEQRIEFSEEARDALRHSVPLTVAVEVILRDAQSRSRLHRFERHYEIRYLPLSQRFQLSTDGDAPPRSFPRLRHALADLGRLDLTYETGVLPGGEYELLARSYLDRERMPPPMRLPALFSPHWDHASDWTARPLHVEPGA